MPRKLDLTGQRFGRLLALREATEEEKCGRKGVFWYCLCNCGNYTVTRTHSLRCGETKSCGCHSKDILEAMKQEDYELWIRTGGKSHLSEEQWDWLIENFEYTLGE